MLFFAIPNQYLSHFVNNLIQKSIKEIKVNLYKNDKVI